VDSCVAERVGSAEGSGGGWRFAYATGSSLPSAWPELESSRTFRTPCATPEGGGHSGGQHAARWPAHAFTKRVKLKTKAAVKGGCG
jgi:hypothetical protein